MSNDPLGRDTSDFRRFVLEAADHALSGKDRDAIDAEVRAAAKRLRLTKDEIDRIKKSQVKTNDPSTLEDLDGDGNKKGNGDRTGTGSREPIENEGE